VVPFISSLDCFEGTIKIEQGDMLDWRGGKVVWLFIRMRLHSSKQFVKKKSRTVSTRKV
jgi:hypothetical protein